MKKNMFLKNTLKIIMLISMCPSSLYPAAATAANSSNGLPSNVALAQEFVPSIGILKNAQDMLNFFTPAKGTGSQLDGTTQQFKNKVVGSLRKLLEAVQTLDFTAYLKERDKVRESALNAQARTGGFANAYSNHAPAVDEVNKRYQEVMTSIQSFMTADTAVAILGENSEVKLRDRIVPLLNVIVKISQ